MHTSEPDVTRTYATRRFRSSYSVMVQTDSDPSGRPVVNTMPSSVAPDSGYTISGSQPSTQSFSPAGVKSGNTRSGGAGSPITSLLTTRFAGDGFIARPPFPRQAARSTIPTLPPNPGHDPP